MGVNITHIIKHDFRQTHDIQLCLEFAKKTIERLKKELLIQSPYESFELQYDEALNEIRFELPIYDIEFSLHGGFWQVESFFHYCQLVMHQGNYFWLRCLTYDIARTLGEEEAWYATEYYTWNGGKCETIESTFEEWYEQAVKDYGKSIPEFDQSAIIAQDDLYPDYEPIYHDSFKECKTHFNRLQSQIVGYKLLGIHRIGKKFVRCEKDGHLFLLNEHTQLPLFTEPIDNVLSLLNGPEFVIVKNGLSAVFNAYGKQLTDFVKGRFEWKWAPYTPLSAHERIIYNKEANIQLHTAWPMFQNE